MDGDDIRDAIRDATYAKAERLGIKPNEFGQVPAISLSDDERYAALEKD